MSDAEILSRIASVILGYNDATGKSIRAENLSLDDHFCDDLGGNSMDLIGMILGFEDEFHIAIGQDDLLEVDPWRLGNLVSYIREQMGVAVE
jgi:acyl carrier protein